MIWYSYTFQNGHHGTASNGMWPFKSIIVTDFIPYTVHFILMTYFAAESFYLYSPSPISFLRLASSLLVATWSTCIYNCLFVHLFIFLYSTYKWNTAFLWLISLSTTEIGSSMLFQMAVFRYLLCLSNIPGVFVCICVCIHTLAPSLSIYLLLGTLVASISWQL